MNLIHFSESNVFVWVLWIYPMTMLPISTSKSVILVVQQDVCISVSVLSKCFNIKHKKSFVPLWTGVWLGSSWKSKVKPCFWRVHTSFSCLPLSFSIHYPLSFSMFLPPIITISLFILVARWRTQVTFLELAFQELAYWTKYSRIRRKNLICLLLIFNDLLGN